MRQIKFRGYQINSCHHRKWVYGSLILNHENKLAYIVTPENSTVQVEWNSIGQYTGINDEKGKEIYEGDIVTADPTDGFDRVVFKSGAFYIESLSNRTFEDELLSEFIVELL